MRFELVMRHQGQDDCQPRRGAAGDGRQLGWAHCLTTDDLGMALFDNGQIAFVGSRETPMTLL